MRTPEQAASDVVGTCNMSGEGPTDEEMADPEWCRAFDELACECNSCG